MLTINDDILPSHHFCGLIGKKFITMYNEYFKLSIDNYFMDRSKRKILGRFYVIS